jgi:uncharacterized protein YciI
MFSAVSEYLAPLPAVDALRAEHHAWVERLYADGVVLVSGRREPPTGGVIVATAPSEQAMQDLLAEDPFVRHGVARYVVYGFAPAAEPLRSPAFRTFAAPAVEEVAR